MKYAVWQKFPALDVHLLQVSNWLKLLHKIHMKYAVWQKFPALDVHLFLRANNPKAVDGVATRLRSTLSKLVLEVCLCVE